MTDERGLILIICCIRPARVGLSCNVKCVAHMSMAHFNFYSRQIIFILMKTFRARCSTLCNCGRRPASTCILLRVTRPTRSYGGVQFANRAARERSRASNTGDGTNLALHPSGAYYAIVFYTKIYLQSFRFSQRTFKIFIIN